MITFAALVCAGGCGSRNALTHTATQTARFPSDRASSQARFLAYGRALIDHTARLMPRNVGARVNCSSCHIAAGTTADPLSLVGVAARFPQWNERSHRYIALQDRIAECFLRSENGTPPAYSSREMIAMVAYITELSRDRQVAPFPAPSKPPLRLGVPKADGATIYATTCAACHGAAGAGTAAAPPLWGRYAFNDGAGMSHLRAMVPFVLRNMPASRPGSLTLSEAYAVSSFVLQRPRPHFDPSRTILAQGRAAGSF